MAVENFYPGGWDACLNDGVGMWADENLLRDGAMSSIDLDEAIQFWERFGLRLKSGSGNNASLKDMCVVASPYGLLEHPCDWVEISEDGCSAWLKGEPIGNVIGPAYGGGDDSDLEDDPDLELDLDTDG